MTMPPRLRSLALTAHVTASVGWLGAVIAYLALAAAALLRAEVEPARAAPDEVGAERQVGDPDVAAARERRVAGRDRPVGGPVVPRDRRLVPGVVGHEDRVVVRIAVLGVAGATRQHQPGVDDLSGR